MASCIQYSLSVFHVFLTPLPLPPYLSFWVTLEKGSLMIKPPVPTRCIQSVCVCVCLCVWVHVRVCVWVPGRVSTCWAKPRDSQTLSVSVQIQRERDRERERAHTQCPLLLPCSHGVLNHANPGLAPSLPKGKPFLGPKSHHWHPMIWALSTPSAILFSKVTCLEKQRPQIALTDKMVIILCYLTERSHPLTKTTTACRNLGLHQSAEGCYMQWDNQSQHFFSVRYFNLICFGSIEVETYLKVSPQW